MTISKKLKDIWQWKMEINQKILLENKAGNYNLNVATLTNFTYGQQIKFFKQNHRLIN